MDLSIFSALFEQIFHNPASLLVILPISIIAYVLEKWEFFPSKFVSLICLALGMILFPNLEGRATVSPTYPNPLLVLILNGLIMGFVAWVVHATLVKMLIDKFTPATAAPTDPPKPPTP